MAALCKHEQFIVQSDAQKTFEQVMLGTRITKGKQPVQDAFLQWVERDWENGHWRLNSLFMGIRSSDIYSYKRLSMKL